VISHPDLLCPDWRNTAYGMVYVGARIGHEIFPTSVDYNEIFMLSSESRVDIMRERRDSALARLEDWEEQWSQVPAPDEWWRE
jgi:hypothetical protein